MDAQMRTFLTDIPKIFTASPPRIFSENNAKSRPSASAQAEPAYSENVDARRPSIAIYQSPRAGQGCIRCASATTPRYARLDEEALAQVLRGRSRRKHGGRHVGG